MTSLPDFACSLCGAVHSYDQALYTCAECGPEGILEPMPPLRVGEDFFTSSPGMWRYERFLALPAGAPRPPLPVGGTALVDADRLGASLGLERLYLKNDALNPTGSLKDRASAAVLARAARLDVPRVAVASTGNAGSSLAGLAASMGMPAAIFVPAQAPRAKLIQALMYGAQVFAVDGSYDDAFDLCVQACAAFGWYNRNTAYNPLTIEGKKTVAFEIFEQLGNRAPDAIFVPTGDGCILSGVARGFRDLLRVGLIERVPRLFAVQAAGTCSIAAALRDGKDIRPMSGRSVADSITVGFPRNGRLAVRDAHESGGGGIVVGDDAILDAARDLAALTGVFAEPAAAASLAGLRAYLRSCAAPPAEETIVLLVTGTGLKDIDAAAKAAPKPISIAPTLASLREAVGAVSSTFYSSTRVR